MTGKQLFLDQGCIVCHGEDLQGTKVGPSLTDAAAHWKVPDLVVYLKDPQAYAAKDERLVAQSKLFQLPMQKYGMLTAKQLEALAEYVVHRR